MAGNVVYVPVCTVCERFRDDGMLFFFFRYVQMKESFSRLQPEYMSVINIAIFIDSCDFNRCNFLRLMT